MKVIIALAFDVKETIQVVKIQIVMAKRSLWRWKYGLYTLLNSGLDKICSAIILFYLFFCAEKGYFKMTL